MPTSLMLKSTQTMYAHRSLLISSAEARTKGAEATFQLRYSILHLSSCFLERSFQLQRAECQYSSRMRLQCNI